MSEWAVKAAVEILCKQPLPTVLTPSDVEEVERIAVIIDRHAAAERSRLAAEVERLLAEMVT
jgi:hypothetical protein